MGILKKFVKKSIYLTSLLVPEHYRMDVAKIFINKSDNSAVNQKTGNALSLLQQLGNQVPTEEQIEQLVQYLTSNNIPQSQLYNTFIKNGYHLLADHFYLPIPNADEVSGEYWDRISQLPGVSIDPQKALSLAQNELAPYFAEFRDLFPLRDQGDGRMPIINYSYMAVDGHMYYALIRHLKPKRIIEIGAGSSSVMAAAACRANTKETGEKCDYTVIEPYPSPNLQSNLTGVGRLIAKKLQDVPLDLFLTLDKNDILFIDSSHVLRSGNDVHYEYLEILPRLSEGVYVHIHDISLPEEYPVVYFENQTFWNEQYLLQAFLAFNNKYKVIWPGNYLMVHHADKMHEIFSEIREMQNEMPQSEPTAFWIQA